MAGMIGADGRMAVTEQQPFRRAWLPAGELAPIGVSLLATLFSTFSIIGISFVLLDLREQIGITTMQVNLLRCTAISSGLLIVFCAGSLCRRFGAKRILSASLALWVVGSLLLAGHAGLLALAAGLVLMGCADAGVRVSSFAMLCGGAADAQQISMLVSANTMANSLAVVASPIINSWILVGINHGATVVGLLWGLMFSLVLVLLLLLVRTDQRDGVGQSSDTYTTNWTFLLAAGACASLISTLPIIRVFQSVWVPPAMALAAGFALIATTAWRKDRAIGEGFLFLRNRRLLLLLLALATLFLIDYRYCAERFLAIRYQLDLASISAWMTPASLAAILASCMCAIAIPKLGLARTIGLSLLGCLILPITFVMAPAQVPILVIASVAASFAFFLTFVRVGLTSMVTAMTDKPLMANLEAVRHVLSSTAWSLGSALAVEVLISTFRGSLEQQLRALPLQDGVIKTIVGLVASGHGRQVLETHYGVSKQLLQTFIGRSATPTIQAIMSVLHWMGWLIFLMLALVTSLIALSRPVGVQMLRHNVHSRQLR
jgi:hypothetical protein